MRRVPGLREPHPLPPAELAIREWARHDTQVGLRLRRVDDRRMQYLRSLFGEFCSGSDKIEARSMLLYSLRMSDYFIAARHGRKSRRQVLQYALAHLLRRLPSKGSTPIRMTALSRITFPVRVRRITQLMSWNQGLVRRAGRQAPAERLG